MNPRGAMCAFVVIAGYASTASGARDLPAASDAATAQTDPRVGDNGDPRRVARGGPFATTYANEVRAAIRYPRVPTYRGQVGFRCVRVP